MIHWGDWSHNGSQGEMYSWKSLTPKDYIAQNSFLYYLQCFSCAVTFGYKLGGSASDALFFGALGSSALPVVEGNRSWGRGNDRCLFVLTLNMACGEIGRLMHVWWSCELIQLFWMSIWIYAQSALKKLPALWSSYIIAWFVPQRDYKAKSL